MKSEFGTPYLQLIRGRPGRAQGTLGHYIVFAEMLMQLGCLAWAMALSTQPQKRGMRTFFAIVFLAVTVALMATQTRADIAGWQPVAFVALWLLGRKQARIWAFAGLLLLGLVATLWIHHTRRLGWISSGDTGTHFRVLMWEDGVRLIRQHPWFGVGMDTIFNHWQEWNIRGFSRYRVIYHFHSDYIQHRRGARPATWQHGCGSSWRTLPFCFACCGGHANIAALRPEWLQVCSLPLLAIWFRRRCSITWVTIRWR